MKTTTASPFSRSNLCLPLLAAVALAWASTGLAIDEDEASPIVFTDCTIGDERARASAECATLDVPLDHERPDGDTLPLAIARIPARRETDGGDPFTLIAGGPGQSARDTWPSVAFAFRHISRDRDVILIDQRGTGASLRLDCPGDESLPTSELDSGARHSSDEIAAAARQCRAALPADPALFTTSVAVRDLEYVRQTLKIARWNIYGVSYGTRVAQHYARRHPDTTRTLILDAVVPAELPLGPDIAPFAQNALDDILARCDADVACATAFPDLRPRTMAWFDILRTTPRTVEYEDLASGQQRRTDFDADKLAAVLRLMSYSAQTASLLPSMLDEAMRNDHIAPLVRQSELQAASLGDMLATGMHHAIVCTEDAPRLPANAADRGQDSYLGSGLIDAIQANCRDWPAGRRDGDFFEPLTSDVPTLVLSGEADPITPAEYGDRVMRTLTTARHIINPAQAHMQAPLGCVPLLMAKFVDTSDPSSLDLTCLERLIPLPFFIDANGPQP